MPITAANIDPDSVARGTALVPAVQVVEPLADYAYVINGAVGFGLTRIASVAPNRVLDAADLTPAVVAGTVLYVFDLDAASTAIATDKATALGMTLGEVVSASLRTGLALLSGVDPGPFTASGLSRQFLPPVIP